MRVVPQLNRRGTLIWGSRRDLSWEKLWFQCSPASKMTKLSMHGEKLDHRDSESLVREKASVVW